MILSISGQYSKQASISFIVTMILIVSSIHAQKDSIPTEQLEPVILKVSRIETEQLNLPLSVSKRTFDRRPYQQQLSLSEYLADVPGLFTLNTHNFSQDLRIAIRGFGARSAFGIRGIKLLVDGIPETTPDGQGQIDNLNLSIIKSIEVLKGPAATLYGNASGGVISISTFDEFEDDFFEARSTFGSFAMKNYQFIAGVKSDKTRFHLHGNILDSDGYRAQSGFENYNANLNIAHQISDFSELRFILNYLNSPFAEDPGGLTLEEVDQDRRQVRARNETFRTEEEIDQFKTGLRYEFKKNDLELSTYAFYSHRNFRGLLPFEFGGIVSLDRHYFGTGATLTLKKNADTHSNTLQLGYDLGFQNDQRQRFRNLEGAQGDQTLGQEEVFRSFGLYALDQLQLGRFLIRAGLRLDANVLKANDQFLTNGDDSGSIDLFSLNPTFGLSYQLDRYSRIFATLGSNFETPTLSELSANPNGVGGFNEDLEAQRSINYEVGYKLQKAKTQLDLNLFYISTTNDLVPFELEAFPDRTFFRNAGSTDRLGFELFWQQKLWKQLTMRLNYTYSDFSYRDFQTPSGTFNDNALPGLPKHMGSLSFQYFKPDMVTIRIENRYVGSLYTDDANSTKDSAYMLTNLTLGTTVNLRALKLSPYFLINNIFDTKYNDNIRINAFGGRYYEPGPGSTVAGGIKLNF